MDFKNLNLSSEMENQLHTLMTILSAKGFNIEIRNHLDQNQTGDIPSEPLIFAAVCDFAAKVRGKGFPLVCLEEKVSSGIGWAPGNIMITCFDYAGEGPFGPWGDLVLMPDVATRIDIQLSERIERVILCDLRTLNGMTWSCCPRSILKHAIARLDKVAGIEMIAAFEHEFQLINGSSSLGDAYALGGFASGRRMGERIIASLRQAGMVPDSFLRELGTAQYEVTIKPQSALRAADEATLLREIVRFVAKDFNDIATFTPTRHPSKVGNGVHIHFSFRRAGQPCTWDPETPSGLSKVVGSFVAGVSRYLPAIVAFTAASRVSYLRLQPHRWSAAFNNLGAQDREAAIRICPITETAPERIANEFNLEYRAADATAGPHLALAMIMHAGCQGIEDGLNTPVPSHEDLTKLSSSELQSRGLERLPSSLEDALERMEQEQMIRQWVSEEFVNVYGAHKRGELSYVSTMNDVQACEVYERVY